MRTALLTIALLAIALALPAAPAPLPRPQPPPAVAPGAYLMLWGGAGGSEWLTVLYPDGRYEARSGSTLFWGHWWYGVKTRRFHVFETCSGAAYAAYEWEVSCSAGVWRAKGGGLELRRLAR